MRTRRLLLAASALSTLAFGCAKDKPGQRSDEGTTQPLPGNPKGVHYDDAVLVTPTASDAAPSDAGPGAGSTPDAPSDASPDGPRDAGVPRDAPKDAGPRRPPDARIYANPKGSTYDKGQDSLE